MSGFGINFLAGTLFGAALTVLAPLATTDLAARNAGGPSTHDVQTVNRAAKADRLHNPQRVKRDVENSKPAKIPVGCDPAFSPLTKNGNNFSSRCLAEHSVTGDRRIVVAGLGRS